jgi:membrane-bound lytic murein transglycosylase B
MSAFEVLMSGLRARRASRTAAVVAATLSLSVAAGSLASAGETPACPAPETAQTVPVPVPEGTTPDPACEQPPALEEPAQPEPSPPGEASPAPAEPAPTPAPAPEPPPAPEAPVASEPPPAAPAATVPTPPTAPAPSAPAVTEEPTSAGAPAAQPRKAERRRAGGTKRPDTEPPRSLLDAPEVPAGTSGPAGEPVFGAVSVDWSSLTALAPPAFGSGEATRFPGPLFLLPIYEAAAAQYNVPWQVLAAINEIETDWGRNTSTSSAGAQGWMQFMPGTWAAWGVDANGDGERNPHDPVDAIFAAARYLKASGAVEDLPRAIFAYNHADWYVARVLERARAIGDLPEDLLATLTAEGRRRAVTIRRASGTPGYLDEDAEARTIGQVMLLGERALRRHVLADERIEIYGCGRQDVEAGIVDRRVLQALAFLAARGLDPAVTSLRCRHGYYTASGNVSEHSSGSAVDIARINGTPILGHQGPGSVTEDTIRMLLRLQGGMRPHQIISLMAYDNASHTYAMGDHADHIHLGFAPLRDLEETP